MSSSSNSYSDLLAGKAFKHSKMGEEHAFPALVNDEGFNQKIDSILAQLKTLNEINLKLDRVTANVKALDGKVQSLSVEFQQIKDKQLMQDKKINALEESTQFNDNRLETIQANITKVEEDSPGLVWSRV